MTEREVGIMEREYGEGKERVKGQIEKYEKEERRKGEAHRERGVICPPSYACK